MNADWPKTVRVGGETYELHPNMPLDDYIDAANAMAAEGQKISELADAMGLTTNARGVGGDGHGE